MDQKLDQLSTCIDSLPDKIDLQQISNLDPERLSLPEQQAKVALSLAFSLSSIYYSVIRSSGKEKALQNNEELQKYTSDIKARFMRLASETKKRDEKAKNKAEREAQKQSIKRIVNNSLASNNRDSKRNLMSSDEDQEESQAKISAQKQEKLGKKKGELKSQSSTGNQRRTKEDMHGATVVPKAAYLEHRKLLDKKF